MLILLTLLGVNLPAQAQQAIAVVAVGDASAIQSLTREEIAAIYLGNLTHNPRQQEVVPLDLEDGEVRDAFYRQVVGRNRNQMRAYWSRQVFTGKGRPPPALPASAVLQQLRSSGNTIGYLPVTLVRPGTRVLLTVTIDG